MQGSTRSQLAKQAALPSAQVLQHRCVICGFWTPDHTKVKSHIRQAHPQVWQETGEAAGPLCAGHSVHTIKGQSCPFCRRHVYDKKEAPTAVCRSFSSLLVLATDTPPHFASGTWSSTTLDGGDSVLERLFSPAKAFRHAGLTTSHAGAASAAPGSCWAGPRPTAKNISQFEGFCVICGRGGGYKTKQESKDNKEKQNRRQEKKQTSRTTTVTTNTQTTSPLSSIAIDLTSRVAQLSLHYFSLDWPR